MVASSLTKGSRVEVSSDEVGFKDAWYVATVLDVVETFPKKKNKNKKKESKNKKKMGYLVKYDTLYEEDDLSVPLTEVVDASFVRPLPPRYPRRNKDENQNQVEEEEGGGGVDFELYDVVDAYHLDGWWTGVIKKVIVNGEISKFIVSFQSPPEEFEFLRSDLRLHLDWVDCQWRIPSKKTPAARRTSMSNNDAHLGFAAPPGRALTTGGTRFSTRKKNHPRKKAKTDAKTVDTVDGSLASSRNKSVLDSAEDNSHAKRSQPSAGKKGSTEHMEGGSRSQVIRQDSQQTIIKEAGVEDGNGQQKRKRGRPPKSQRKKRNGLLEGNQEAGERVSSAIDEMLDEQPLSTWCQGVARDHCDALNETHEALPFTKLSPAWAIVESLELYKNPPQNPHFSPLKKVKEDYREGLAIGHMVTFANLVERASRLEVGDASDVIESSLETLVELERHGFDVGGVRGRLKMLMATKTKLGELASESNQVKSELMKVNLEKSAIEEEINELVGKMKELQEKLAYAVTMKNTKHEEIVMLRSKLHLIYDQITAGKLDFKKLATTSL